MLSRFSHFDVVASFFCNLHSSHEKFRTRSKARNIVAKRLPVRAAARNGVISSLRVVTDYWESDSPHGAPWSSGPLCRWCIPLGSGAPACARRSRHCHDGNRSEIVSTINHGNLSVSNSSVTWGSASLIVATLKTRKSKFTTLHIYIYYVYVKRSQR